MHLHQELEDYYLGIDPMDSMRNYELRMTNDDIPSSQIIRNSKFVSRHSPCGLLIIEDFDSIRALLSHHFKQRGFAVCSSATVRDALTLAREEHPKIIILDYDLSCENALNAIERLRAVLSDSYIVLMGGPGTPDVDERATHAGASAMLAKAYRLSELDEIIDGARRTIERPTAARARQPIGNFPAPFGRIMPSAN